MLDIPTNFEECALIMSIFNGVRGHKPTTQAQRVCALVKQCLKDLKGSAFKLGMLMYSLSKCQLIALNDFDSFASCAQQINNMFGLQMISGFQIKQAAVDKDRIAMSSSKQGSQGQVSDCDAWDLAMHFLLCWQLIRTIQPDISSLLT